MKDFNIVKYLKENKQGAYGRFNGYVDLKPLKEEEENIPAEDDSELDPDTVPYEAEEDQLTGLGDTDSFEQDDIVSENEEEYPDYTHIMDLGGERIEQGIISLLDDGFSEEDILELCQMFVKDHADARAQGKNF